MSKRMAAVMVILGVLLPAFARPSLAQGPQEGIKVHGHWVIDVRNPDGTLASHTEFENALKPGGAGLLATLLSREASAVRGWTVVIGPGNGAFGLENQFDGSARIFEAALGDHYGPANSTNRFGTLVVGRVLNAVILKGTATAVANGEINRVATELGLGYANGNGLNDDFSGTSLPTAVALSAGQIIQVSVELSFS